MVIADCTMSITIINNFIITWRRDMVVEGNKERLDLERVGIRS